MLRAALVSVLFLAALVTHGCSRAPSVRMELHRLDGPRPPQLALRCRQEGLKPPVAWKWRFPAAVKQIGWGVPSDEAVVLVQSTEPAPSWAECTATGDD
jgi:hypothetical protein